MRAKTTAWSTLRRFFTVAGAILLCVAGALLVFARTMDRDLNHDEHQFLAPAALLSREGLLPWIDYPLFHLPNLVLLYGAMDAIGGNLLLGAKLASFLATAGVLIMLIWMNSRPRRAGFFGALLIAALFLSDALVRFTIGKTWNHEVPTALLLAALGLFVAAARDDRLLLTVAAGVSAGLAVGCRLTFAPALIGMAVLTWFFPGSVGRRSAHLAILTCAATAALAPSLWFLATAPEAFAFGNLEFPRLRLLDPTNLRVQKTATLWRKARYFLKEIVLPSWPIFVLWGMTAGVSGWRWFRNRAEPDRAAAFTLVLLPFLLFGCFTPLRYQAQHSYVLIPVLLFAASSAIHWEHWRGRKKAALLTAGLLVALFTSWRASEDYVAIRKLPDRDNWYDARLRKQVSGVAALVEKGPVLTLAPALPLMAGLSIYPEFATGPFAWRSAWLVPAERRKRLRLVAPDDLRALLAQRPPTAILTGVEDEELEAPFIKWAEERRWQPIGIRKKLRVWLPPSQGPAAYR